MIFSILRAAYRIRSKLVHGIGINSEIKLSSGEFVTDIELGYRVRDILRKSILVFLDLSNTHSHNDLTSSLLDENILSQGTLLNLKI